MTKNEEAYQAPVDNEAFYREHFEHICMLVRKGGIEGVANQQDVASAIFVRLVERNFIDLYDEEKVGPRGRATFRTFLSKSVKSYVMGFRDKQEKIKSREAVRLDAMVGNEAQESLGEVFNLPDRYRLPSHEDQVVEMLRFEKTREYLRTYLVNVPRKSASDNCDVIALFDAVAERAVNFKEIDKDEMAREFGVSSTAMHNWLWWLKENSTIAMRRAFAAKKHQGKRPATATGTP